MGKKVSSNIKEKATLIGIPLIIATVIAVSFYKPYYFESNPQKLKVIGVDYLKKANYKDAINSLSKALDEDKNEELEYQLAKAYLKSNQQEKAFELASKILNNNPEYTGAILILGKYYSLKGEDKKALEYYEKALKISDSAEVNFAIGKYYFDKKNTPKAFEHLTKSHDQNPERPELYPVLAEVYRNKGLFVSAYNSYDAYIQLKCKQGIPYSFLITKEADEIQRKMKALRDMAHEM